MTERLHKIVWLGAVVAAVLFGQDTPGPPARKLPLPADVLNESHLTGEQLLPANRCFLYLELAHAAATIAPGLARQWSQEVFDLAQQLPSGWNRSALRKNAIQGMAAVDPARAFAMIPSMETPVPISGDIIPEDLRASVAGWVYPQFWSQEQSATRMASIRAQAQTIASTGQYPFAGVVPILEYLAEHDRQQEEAWWSELIRIYQADTPRIRDRDEKLLSFLRPLGRSRRLQAGRSPWKSPYKRSWTSPRILRWGRLAAIRRWPGRMGPRLRSPIRGRRSWCASSP